MSEKKVQVTPEEIVINGATFVPKDNVVANTCNGLPLVIIRSRDSGVHYGYLENRTGDVVTLVNSRRIWYWKGAFTLSEIANTGVKDPVETKLSTRLDSIMIFGVCEIIPVKKSAQTILDGIKDYSR